MHWREGLVPFLAQSGYQPLDDQALARKLRVPPEELAAFEAFLREQERAGQIMQVRHSLYVLPKRLGFCVGHLQMNERGFGFLVPSDPAEPDFYIAGEDTANALHGDLVLARLKEQRGGRQRDTRLRGEVVQLLQRKRRQTCRHAEPQRRCSSTSLPDEARIPHDISVPAPEGPPPLGQKVVVELKEWPDRRKPPEGAITEVLGAPDAPGVDLLSIIHKYDLPTSFPEQVEQQAADISGAHFAERRSRVARISASSSPSRSIPDDAKDFDDALSYRMLPDGDFEILHPHRRRLVLRHPGTPLDVEARARGNSVYLVDRVIPMLPEKLSNGICSLQPNVDRLVKTAIVTLDSPRRNPKKFRFAEGIIHSAKRFTYQEALALLRKPADDAARHTMSTTLNAMAQILRKRRFARGRARPGFAGDQSAPRRARHAHAAGENGERHIAPA